MSIGPDDLLGIDLTRAQRQVLMQGLVEWGGPARCTEEMALAMGFAGKEGLRDHGLVLIRSLREGLPLSVADWRRVMLATEIVFISDVLGAGLDWKHVAGMSDEDTLTHIRAIQHKMPRWRGSWQFHQEEGERVFDDPDRPIV